jgi:hypothetical protein
MVDTDTRGAARLAVFVAVPIAVVVGVVTFWWMGGLGSTAKPARPRAQSTAPVATTAGPLAGQATTACPDLLGRIPATGLRDRPRRTVTAGADRNAAYGDPAITLTCGVPAPTLPVGADVYLLSGVCWYSETDGTATVWTTVDRDTAVRVRVPKAYEAPGQWVIEFSPAVTAALPRAATPPAGC